MKRLGRILFCFLPLLTALAVQILIGIPAFGITAVSIMLKNYHAGLSVWELYSRIISVFSSGTFMIWLSMICAVACLCLFGFWYRTKLTEKQVPAVKAAGFNRWIVAAMLILAAGLQYVFVYLISFIGAVRPEWMRVYEDLMNSAGIRSLSPITVIYACIIAPVSEELIFRGVTYGYAKKAMPVIWAVCLQAVLFGIYHMNIIQGIYASILGLFLGYLYTAGGTIFIPMLFHAFFNIWGMFGNSFMYYRISQPFFFLLWLTVGVLLTYAGIFLFQHGIAVRDIIKNKPDVLSGD